MNDLWQHLLKVLAYRKSSQVFGNEQHYGKPGVDLAGPPCPMADPLCSALDALRLAIIIGTGHADTQPQPRGNWQMT